MSIHPKRELPERSGTAGSQHDTQPLGFDDPRVKELVFPYAPKWVGPLKGYACDHCTGDILLELDHDDLLMPTAVEEVQKAFEEDPEVGFTYSNTVHMWVGPNGQEGKVQRFDEAYGWKYREVDWKGLTLDEHISFEPTPDSISRIWFAPNHLRAFRRDVYQQVGGYNLVPSLSFSILPPSPIYGRLSAGKHG